MPAHYRSDIDGLRALAVIAVLGFHGFPEVVSGGFVGVDVFFVISGFLISKILGASLEAREFTFWDFYSKRVKRLFPSLLTVLASCIIVGWAVFYRDEFFHLCTDISTGISFFSNIALWNETSYFSQASSLKPLLHLWSLAIEEQFYLAWPPLLFICWKLKIKRAFVIATLIILSFIANLLMVTHHPSTTFFLPMYRAWELLLGALLAEKISSKKSNNLYSVVGLALILGSAFYFSEGVAFPGWRALLPTFGAALLVYGGPEAWINRKILSSSPLVFIGLISFPLYLWHWPLLSFAKILLSGRDSGFLRGFLLFVSFVLAWLTYIFIEKPLRQNKSAGVAPALVTAAFALLIFSLVIRRTDPLLYNYFQSQRNQLLWDENGEKFNSTKFCRDKFNLHGNDDKCLISKPDSLGTIAIVGDSHANSLYFGLEDYFNRISSHRENVVNIGRGGCPPFLNTTSETIRGGAESQCAGAMTGLLNKVISSPSIHTVILANQGRLYLAGYRTLETTEMPSSATPAEVYDHQLRSTIRRLLQAKKKVILALDFPDFDFDPRLCLSRFPTLQPRRGQCNEKLSAIEARRGPYKTIMNNVINDFSEVQYIDLDSVFCSDGLCAAMKDGVLLYRDAAHLSLAGSLYISNKLKIQSSHLLIGKNN